MRRGTRRRHSVFYVWPCAPDRPTLPLKARRNTVTETITNADVRQMVAIARDYAEADNTEALPWELLQDLRALIRCDAVLCSGMDTPRWEFFASQELREGPPRDVDEDALNAAFAEHYWGSTCAYPDTTGDIVSVLRWSDHQSDRERHSSPMYADHGRLLGVERDVMVCLDAGRPQRTLRLIFTRGSGPDFSGRDVAVLTLLRPHLQAAYVATERRRRGLLPLTSRQRQILQFVAAGYSNRQIARRLDVRESTVAKHLENIFARLEVTSRTAAAARLQPPL
jgi:DNA-binding CsgD family transcriptional regulator